MISRVPTQSQLLWEYEEVLTKKESLKHSKWPNTLFPWNRKILSEKLWEERVRGWEDISHFKKSFTVRTVSFKCIISLSSLVQASTWEKLLWFIKLLALFCISRVCTAYSALFLSSVSKIMACKNIHVNDERRFAHTHAWDFQFQALETYQATFTNKSDRQSAQHPAELFISENRGSPATHCSV